MKKVNADLAEYASCDEQATPFQHAHRISDNQHSRLDILEHLIIFGCLLLVGCHTPFYSFQFCDETLDFADAFRAAGNHFFADLLQLCAAGELVITNIRQDRKSTRLNSS